jgi:asparagine synthase (glutamine-hydrolysing)
VCGICGILKKDNKPASEDIIGRMCSVMIHRGPDDEGHYMSGSVGLGMRRLKIIDLETGNQPIHNEDKAIWVVLNGEIYNYRDIRALLEKKGHTFYTKSDTEVIVHLYEDYGEKALDFLNGMYGIALWDTRNEKLLLARDRLGIKQIYYHEDDDCFAFGSEIKTVMAYGNISKEIDYQALSDFFSFKYIPAPHTIFSKIKKLPQACFLTIDLKTKYSAISKYWTLKYREPYISSSEVIESTNNELKRAIEYQMISDVPLGAYLSGGIDSSLLVAIMSKLTEHPVETFSIIWDTGCQMFDEREYARFVAKEYKTNHHEFLVKPNIEEVIQNIIGGFDEPFADDSAIPNYYIASETRKFVTVALSGLGGDEMCAGYERYLGVKLLHYYHTLPDVLRKKIISKLMQKMPDSKTGWPWIDRMKRFVKIADMPFSQTYFSISSKLDSSEKRLLFTDDINRKIGTDYSTLHYFKEYTEECNSDNDLNRMLYIDINTYMVDQLLVLSDRMSMAHSLELRVPYLDHQLVEHFAKIDPLMKLHGIEKKYLLKKVAERYFPEKFIYRKKMGFSSPIAIWLRGDLKNFMLHILNRESIIKTGIINPDTVECYTQEHIAMKHNHELVLWPLIMFMLWYDSYIQKIYKT